MSQWDLLARSLLVCDIVLSWTGPLTRSRSKMFGYRHCCGRDCRSCEAAGHHAAAAAALLHLPAHVEDMWKQVRTRREQVEGGMSASEFKTNKQFLRFHNSHDRKLYIEHPQAQRRNHGHKSLCSRYSDSQSVAVCLSATSYLPLCMTMMQRSQS